MSVTANAQSLLQDHVPINRYEARLMECFSIEDSDKSFACMQNARKEFSDEWQAFDATDPITDEKSIIRRLTAKSTTSPNETYLAVTCKDNKETLVLINWGTYVSRQEHQIEYRFDNNPPIKDIWFPTSDADTSFIAPHNKALAFGIEIAKHKKLAIRVSPKNQGAITATFDLTNSDVALTKIIQSCNWDFDPFSIDKDPL